MPDVKVQHDKHAIGLKLLPQHSLVHLIDTHEDKLGHLIIHRLGDNILRKLKVVHVQHSRVDAAHGLLHLHVRNSAGGPRVRRNVLGREGRFLLRLGEDTLERLVGGLDAARDSSVEQARVGEDVFAAAADPDLEGAGVVGGGVADEGGHVGAAGADAEQRGREALDAERVVGADDAEGLAVLAVDRGEGRNVGGGLGDHGVYDGLEGLVGPGTGLDGGIGRGAELDGPGGVIDGEVIGPGDAGYGGREHESVRSGICGEEESVILGEVEV